MLNSKLLSAMGGVDNYIEDVFSTWLYTGNDSTQTITNGIDLAGEGGLVWTKRRNSAIDHALVDTIRGVSSFLSSNLTNGNQNCTGDFTSFGSAGYTLGTPTSTNGFNQNTGTYASWTFRKQPNFFDVVTFTQASGATTTFNHNLGSTPGCMLIKTTGVTNFWLVYHTSLGNDQYIILNSTGAAQSYSGGFSVSSTSVTINNALLAATGNAFVAYLFAHNAGGFGLTGTDNVISCGSFTTDAGGLVTVNLGYEPQWLLVKCSSNAENWNMMDQMRGWNMTTTDATLYANLSNAESTANWGNPTATGFDASFGASRTYIYIAIRRGPMKTPTTGTSVFLPYSSSSTSVNSIISTGFPVDLMFSGQKNSNNSSDNWSFIDRLRGGMVNTDSESGMLKLLTTTTSAEASLVYPNAYRWWNTSVVQGIGLNGASVSYQFFRRAPGFFDEVCYTGTGADIAGLATNLGVQPELVFLKRRNSTSDWGVGIKVGSSTNYYSTLRLNSTAALGSFVFGFTSTGTLSVPSGFSVSGGTYVAYLFASCPNVSKVFSYTGNGSSQTINCGFTGGARFVMIKRTDSTGDWYVWDSARGIVAGNDPRLSLNTIAAEVTTDDSVDTASTGFIVNQVAATNINVSSATYIGLAIA